MKRTRFELNLKKTHLESSVAVAEVGGSAANLVSFCEMYMQQLFWLLQDFTGIISVIELVTLALPVFQY